MASAKGGLSPGFSAACLAQAVWALPTVMSHHMFVRRAAPAGRAFLPPVMLAEPLYPHEFHALEAKTTQNPTKTLTHPYK